MAAVDATSSLINKHRQRQKWLVFGDVHSNLAAFKAVLDDVGTYDKAVFLGDAVAQGREPEEVLDLLRGMEVICCMGNHDSEVVNNVYDSEHEEEPCSAIWTRRRISQGNYDYLCGFLPSARVVIEGQSYRFHHGDHLGERIYSDSDDGLFRKTAALFDEDTFVFGHCHVPFIKQCFSKRFVSIGAVGMDQKYKQGIACYATISGDAMHLHEVPWGE